MMLNKHYPTKLLVFFQNKVRIADSLFMSILFHFVLILLKLEHALIIAGLLNQNSTKKVMLLYKKIVLIRCCKWISFQSAEYNHY